MTTGLDALETLLDRALAIADDLGDSYLAALVCDARDATVRRAAEAATAVAVEPGASPV